MTIHRLHRGLVQKQETCKQTDRHQQKTTAGIQKAAADLFDILVRRGDGRLDVQNLVLRLKRRLELLRYRVTVVLCTSELARHALLVPEIRITFSIIRNLTVAKRAVHYNCAV